MAAPGPSATAPGVDSCLGLGEVDGEPFEILVRVRPGPDDPVIVRIPGFPPEGTSLDEVVAVEAGQLVLAFEGVCEGEGGAADGPQRLDQDSVLTLVAGSEFAIGGAGIAPNGEVAVYLFSDPTLIGSSVAGPDGSFLAVGVITEDTPLGPHVLQVTGVGGDGRAYRLSFGVTVVGPDVRGNLLDLRGLWLVALLLPLLLSVLAVTRLLRRRLCILVGFHPDVPLAIAPGVAAPGVPPLPVASFGRRPVPAEFRSGRAGLAPRDRSFVATDLRLVGEDLLDLTVGPVPVTSTIVVESDGLTLVAALRRSDGSFEPLDESDGQLRHRPGSSLVLAIGGAPRRARIDVTLRDMTDDGVVDEELLARLRAADDGQARAEVVLAERTGARPFLVQVCVAGWRGLSGS